MIKERKQSTDTWLFTGRTSKDPRRHKYDGLLIQQVIIYDQTACLDRNLEIRCKIAHDRIEAMSKVERVGDEAIDFCMEITRQKHPPVLDQMRKRRV